MYHDFRGNGIVLTRFAAEEKIPLWSVDGTFAASRGRGAAFT